MDRRMSSNSAHKPPVRISIIEKSESEVSHCWKICQLFSYLLIIISGIATCLAVGNVQRMFNWHCPMHANLSFKIETEDYYYSLTVLPYISFWGSRHNCNWVQFCPVASVMFAMIWGTMFVVCGRGGVSSRSLPRPWRIVPPALLFNSAFVILSSIVLYKATTGFQAFCLNITTELNVTSCEDLIGLHWVQYPLASNFYDDIVITETGCVVTVVGWSMSVVILLARIFSQSDFRVNVATDPQRRMSSCPFAPRASITNDQSGSSGSTRHTSSLQSQPASDEVQRLV